eukprot:m.434678 g.434678  ORF g.434678 m.434678 type:complete len:270 (+) comp56759_c0_seq4:646-1455(+)
MGGFVRWTRGVRADGTDSIATQVCRLRLYVIVFPRRTCNSTRPDSAHFPLAEQVVPETHWPEMHVLVLVVNASKKAVSSTSGMETSVLTSDLIKHRADVVVPARMAAIEKAIVERDFEAFARITMQDSNQFHAICLDTYPPIFYMNDISRLIIQMLTQYNAASGHIKAAYTFDAGPNAVIYALEKDIPEIISLVARKFPNVDPSTDFFRGITTHAPDASAVRTEIASAIMIPEQPGAVKYILHTRVGPGPRVADAAESLLGVDGFPKSA